MSLNGQYEAATASIQSLLSTLAEEKRALEEEKAQWLNMECKLDTSNLADPITLNVGGTHFALTLKDLTSKPGSYFAAMFSGRWDAKEDKNGAFFINRNQVVFHYVADHLRGREIPVDLLTPLKRALLKDDAEFYRLDSLVDVLKPKQVRGELKFMTDITSPYITYSDDGRTATKTSGGDNWNCTVVGPEMVWPDKGFSEVRVKHAFSTNSTMIGLAPSQAIIACAASGSATYSTTGWYLHTIDGTLYGQDGQTKKTYANPANLLNGAVVAVRLHDDGRISFVVNGTDFRTAYVVPMQQSCRVAVMMKPAGTTVELVE